MASENQLVCTGIRRAYQTDGDLVWALWDVDVGASSGQITVLAGPSGSGKSTLLRVMAGIDRPDEGTVHVAGQELTGLSTRQRRRFRRRNLGFVFQDPAANLLSYMTVRDHLDMAAAVRHRPVALDLLEALEISDLADELPHRLSAGQQQRVALAAAVTGRPEIVLADEPTAELDTQSALLAVDTLARLRDMDTTLIVTSHDPEVIDIADRVVRIEHGQVTS